MNNRDTIKMVETMVEAGDLTQLRDFLAGLDFHLIAKAVNRLSGRRFQLFSVLSPEIQAETVLKLSNQSREEILNRLADGEVAQFLQFNDDDDVTDLLQALSPERRESIVGRLRSDRRGKIESLFKFSPETAGGLMDLNFIIVKPDYTLKDVADKVQKHYENERKMPFVIVTDEKGKLQGYLSYKTLITSPPSASITRLAKTLPAVPYHADQEEVMHLAQGSGIDIVGVTDEAGLVLGVVHLHDLLRVAESEATEDVYSFAGVHKDEDIGDSAFYKVKRRWLWLVINLGTAVLASFVVSRFQTTISQISLLAVFMPMVAGEGGNAATQALAVVVRGLAMGEVPWSEARKVIAREALAGSINGLIVGLMAALVAFIFHAPPVLALVLGFALIVNLFVAGLFGATVPFVLKRFKIDPATASSIFVTTATDVFGFLVFLGLGTALLT
jgi:magnesium transporter